MKASASDRLAAYLAKHTITTAEFARSVRANRSQVYRLLTGERGPSVDLAARIEQATGGVIAATDWASTRRPTAKGRPAPRRRLARSSEISSKPAV